MKVTVLGIVTDFNELHSAKAYFPIVFSLVPNVILLKLEQLEKAKSPIDVAYLFL